MVRSVAKLLNILSLSYIYYSGIEILKLAFNF